MIITLRYFASLRDAAGCADERIDGEETATPRTLYAQAAERYGFALPPERLRVAVNGDFADAGTALRDGDEVAFLPPVSGG